VGALAGRPAAGRSGWPMRSVIFGCDGVAGVVRGGVCVGAGVD
jgi:hypothetical protein